MNTEVLFDQTAFSVSQNIKKSLRIFGNIDNKISLLDSPSVEEIIDLVEDIILNNQHRQIGLSRVISIYADRRQSICEEIRKETSYLSGTILPMLYKRKEELDSVR